MSKIKLFSRHNLNDDQKNLLKEMFGKDVEVTEPLNPFFADAKNLGSEISRHTVILVAPWDMILEAIAEEYVKDGTRLIAWRADKHARIRGNFGCRGAKVFEIQGFGRPEIIGELNWEPTVETDFRSGESTPYQGTE